MAKTLIPALRNRTALPLVFGLVLALGSFSPQSAHAVVPPPCEATECPSAGPAAFSGITSAVTAALATLEQDIYLNFLYVKDAISRLANQHSNTRQGTIKSIATIADRTLAHTNAVALGAVRAQVTSQAMPSRTACGVESRRATVVQASAYSRAAVGASETINTGILTNAAGTPGNRGQLAYVSARFSGRMTRYCNNATVQAPSGIPCTASIGVDRDILPADSVFKQGALTDTNDYQAARDVVLNIMGDAVKDPVRGPALRRDEGQPASLYLYSDQAKLNLASSVLMSMVERRRDMAGTSEFAEQTNTTYTGLAASKLAEINAGQTESQNLDTVAAMIGDSTRSIFVLRDYLEQWAAIRAVSLAVEVKQNPSAGAASSASRPMGN